VGDNAKWTVLLDLDDTLIDTGHLYHLAGLRCAQIISAALGPKSLHPLTLFQRQYEIDSEMVRIAGFAPDRYPRSWVKTYEERARAVGLAADRKVCAALMRAGGAFVRGPFMPFKGAKEALVTLQRDGHSLHLVTAGDKRLQRRKVAKSGLGPLFDSVNVTGTDKKPVMAKIAGDAGGRVVMVGDSKRSDIAPAIELGLVAVHIPGDTWPFAQAELDRRKYHEIASVRELPALMRTLSRKRTARASAG